MIVCLLIGVLIASPCFALPGDLNNDGRVDIQDFHILADNLGKIGPVEPADTVHTVEVRHDTIFAEGGIGQVGFFGFAGRGDVIDWFQSETWSVDEGRLIGVRTDEEAWILYPETVQGDVAISVTSEWLRGIDNNAYGILFHNLEGYGFKFFGISRNGSYFLLRWDAPTSQWETLVEWTQTSVIHQQGQNALALVSMGGMTALYINGQKVEVLFDEAPESGFVGLRVSGEQAVAFDDLQISNVVGATGQTVVVHDTVEVLVDQPIVVRDTVFVSDVPRPPERSWSEVTSATRNAVYWLGVSTLTASSTLFLGTGFAVSPTDLATNAHVVFALNIFADGLEEVGEKPIIVAVRSNTFAYSGGTIFLPRRSFFTHPDYNGTVESADIATIFVLPGEREPFPSYLPMAPRPEIFGIDVGDEVATLGFPGEIEIETEDARLQPIPTFKSGTVSALRPYDPTTFSQRLTNKIVQHNLDLSPGTSGSPIFNKRGEVIAVNNAGVIGTSLGFGIRADELREIFEAWKVEFPSLFADLRLKRVAYPLRRGTDSRSLLSLLAGWERGEILGVVRAPLAKRATGASLPSEGESKGVGRMRGRAPSLSTTPPPNAPSR